MAHALSVLHLLKDIDEFTTGDLEKITTEPYFVPLDPHLNAQLLNFQRQKIHIGLVIDEFSVILGLVTLEEILDKIVGEFTADLQFFAQDIHPRRTAPLSSTVLHHYGLSTDNYTGTSP